MIKKILSWSRLSSKIYWVILLGIILLTAYFNRWIFYYNFEPEYWENYYYESQWNIPQSKRVINDEGLYRYVGYRYVNGENPFDVVWWVPPLGQYLYGFSAKYFSNPYLTTFVFYLSTLLVFGLLCSELFCQTKVKWLVIYLFALNPLLVEQVQQTMLDLPLTLFLLLCVYSLFKITRENSNIFVVFSGIALGLMTGTKPPYYIPVITTVCLLYLFSIRGLKSWKYFFPSIIVGYLLAYFCYFIRHPNPIPFIRLHQKIIDFQRNNVGSHDWINILRTIFLARYKGFWVGAKTIVPLNWSIILPAGALGLLYLFFRIARGIEKDKRIIFLVMIALAYIIMNFFIDFWPRYLLPLIPVYTILLGYIFKDRKWVHSLFLISLLPSLYLLLFPSSESFKELFKRQFELGLYRETYRMLSYESREGIDETKWKEINQRFNLKMYSVELDNERLVKLVKENNQWRISWQADN